MMAKKKIDGYIFTADKINIDEKALWVLITEMEYYRTYDDLSTGLYNRNYWEHLKDGVVKFLYGSSYSLIVIDIDNLKECNDLYGHVIGDEVIASVGESILNSVRENDVAIHYGGDEFIVILPNANIAVANKVITRIKKDIKKKYINKKLKIEVSAGASYSNDISKLEQALQSADMKMYSEKNRKKKL
jgi:diguanylate cyclase (GGDEF)-like protein